MFKHDPILEAFWMSQGGGPFDFDDVLKTFLPILDANPDDTEALYWVASAYYYNDAFVKAIPYLAREAQLKPTDKEVLIHLSACYHEVKDYHRCYQTMRKLIALDPTEWRVFDSLVYVCGKLGKKDEAVYYGEEALGRGGAQHSMTYNNLANAHMELGQYAKALPLLQMAIQLDETNPIAQKNLAKAYMHMEALGKAKPIIQSLLHLYPDDPELVEAMKQIQTCGKQLT